MANQEQMALLMLKGAISDMPAEDQQKIAEAAEKIRVVMRESGEHGELALCLAAAEYAASAK